MKSAANYLKECNTGVKVRRFYDRNFCLTISHSIGFSWITRVDFIVVLFSIGRPAKIRFRKKASERSTKDSPVLFPNI